MVKTILIVVVSISLTIAITLDFTQYREIKKENEALKVALLENVDENLDEIDFVTTEQNEDTNTIVAEEEEVLPTPTPSTPPPTPTPVINRTSPTATQTVAPEITPTQPQTTPSSPPVTSSLEILNIKAEPEKTSVKISWTTSIKSESRLLIHRGGRDEIFPSDTINGTSHSVLIGGLSDSSNYTFEIIAKADGKDVSKFDKFFTKRVFGAIHEGRNAKECNVFKITDSQNNPLVGGSVTISSHGQGATNNTTNYIWPNQTVTADSNGRVAYCNLPSIPARAKIVYNATNETIFDGLLYY